MLRLRREEIPALYDVGVAATIEYFVRPWFLTHSYFIDGWLLDCSGMLSHFVHKHRTGTIGAHTPYDIIRNIHNKKVRIGR